jgi:hypothetical protein
MESLDERRYPHLANHELYQSDRHSTISTIAIRETSEREHVDISYDERELMDFFWAQEDLESQSEHAADPAERRRATTELASIREQYPELYIKAELLKQEIAARAVNHSTIEDGFNNGTK